MATNGHRRLLSLSLSLISHPPPQLSLSPLSPSSSSFSDNRSPDQRLLLLSPSLFPLLLPTSSSSPPPSSRFFFSRRDDGSPKQSAAPTRALQDKDMECRKTEGSLSRFLERLPSNFGRSEAPAFYKKPPRVGSTHHRSSALQLSGVDFFSRWPCLSHSILHAAAMGFPMVFCPSLRKVFSSKRGPATRSNPFNNRDTSAIGREREMQDEGRTFHTPGCFGPQVAQQTPSEDKTGKKNKPLAIIRKFLKRKSESSSTEILLRDTSAEEAQIPAGSSQNTAWVTSPLDPRIGQFNVLVDAENMDRETEEKSPLCVSSAHTCRTVTCDVKKGNHESMAAGDEDTRVPEILSVIPRLEKEKDEKTENYLLGDSLAGTCSIVTRTDKTRARVTLKMLMAMEDSEKTIGGGKEKETEVFARLDRDKNGELSNSPRNCSQVENRGTVGSTSKARNCKSRITLEDLVQDEATGEGEMEFGVRDCVYGPVKPSSGSTFFAHPYPLFPPSPRPLSSSSPCSPAMYSEGLHSKDTPAEKARIALEAPQELGRSMPLTGILLKDAGAEEAQVPAEMSPNNSGSSLSGPSCSLSSCTPSSVSLMSLSLSLLERSLSLSSLSFSLSRGPLDAEAAEMAALEVAKVADKAQEAAKAAREAANEAMAVEAAAEWEAKEAAREESTKELTAIVAAEVKVKVTDEMAAVPLCQKRLGGSSKRVVGPIFFESSIMD